MEEEESWDSKASSDVTGMTEDEFNVHEKEVYQIQLMQYGS
jgi:hypothetical protein